jgi:hypothetical protein
MSFIIPDLIIESILRDGFNNARRDNTVIDDIFEDLTLAFNSKKYGESEVEKIKKIINDQEVSIVHSFNLVNSNLPCISIQLADDRENENEAHMGNYVSNLVLPLTDPDELAALIYVDDITPTSYNVLTGAVLVPDSVNLAGVHANLLFEDSAGAIHTIIGGIINEPGSKQFMVEKGGSVALGSGGIIKSSLDYKIYQKRGNIESTQLILGIHTKEALLTKYLYILVKYFMLSRRDDLIARGLQLNTYTGSDFTRNMEYVADVVYTRFFNVSGRVQHQWRSDKVQLIDNVEVNVTVPKDRAGNEELGLTDSTIKVKE